jgi:hypothetical protein
LEYLEEETFGASLTNVPQGRYFKESSNTYNFVALTVPTPGGFNSPPAVGPIVISEIMYHPSGNGDAEYIELANISREPVTLFDELNSESWRFVDGFDFAFPSDPPVTMQPGERILLVRNEAIFRASYSVPPETQIFQWFTGALNNDGEKLELAEPGDVDENLVRQFIRVDRVNFNDAIPWPVGADGLGASLTRRSLYAYGNDSANWIAATPTPGTASVQEVIAFSNWVEMNALPEGLDDYYDDPDQDGILNLFEYAYGTPPLEPGVVPPTFVQLVEGNIELTFQLAAGLDDLIISVEQSGSLESNSWENYYGDSRESVGDSQLVTVTAPISEEHMFFRLEIVPR